MQQTLEEPHQAGDCGFGVAFALGCQFLGSCSPGFLIPSSGDLSQEYEDKRRAQLQSMISAS